MISKLAVFITKLYSMKLEQGLMRLKKVYSITSVLLMLQNTIQIFIDFLEKIKNLLSFIKLIDL